MNNYPLSYSPVRFGSHTYGFTYGDTEAIASLALKKGGYVCTPNALMLEYAEMHPQFAKTLENAAMLVPDGIGALLALRTEGIRANRCTGVALGMAVAKQCAQKKRSLYLYGGQEGRARDAAICLRRRFPTLRIAGYSSGYGDKKTAAARIRHSGADVVFVCLGSPLQEIFMQSYLPPHITALGLGGAIDIYSGSTRRAPASVQRMGGEWLYRMLREPHRIKKVPELSNFCLLLTHNLVKKSNPRLFFAQFDGKNTQI